MCGDKMIDGLILVDDEIHHDHRVQGSIREAVVEVRVLDIRTCHQESLSISQYLSLLKVVVFALCNVIRARKIYGALGLSLSDNGVLSGFKAFLRWLSFSVRSATYIQNTYNDRGRIDFHAHDLYCAFVVTLLPTQMVRQFIYDSHEFQIHRNRKTGLFRVVAEHYLEQRILNCCTELRLVNHAVIPTTRQLYGDLKMPIKVIYNNQYSYQPVVKTQSNRLAMVYVGKGTNGRRLHSLDAQTCSRLQIDCFMYFLGNHPKDVENFPHWTLGSDEYLPEVLQNMRSHRCLMWCCLRNFSYSYQMATPNKFFQAIAVGMPIVASQGSYLAEIVKQYDLGFILEDDDLSELTQVSLSPKFFEWVDNIAKFRDLLKENIIQI